MAHGHGSKRTTAGWRGAVRCWDLAEGQLGWARYYRIAEDLQRARSHAERAREHASAIHGSLWL